MIQQDIIEKKKEPHFLFACCIVFLLYCIVLNYFNTVFFILSIKLISSLMWFLESSIIFPNDFFKISYFKCQLFLFTLSTFVIFNE